MFASLGRGKLRSAQSRISSGVDREKRTQGNECREGEAQGGLDQKGVPQIQSQTGNAFKIPGNGKLPPAGKTGAGHTLRRLEEEEQRAYARMQAALERGNPIEVQNAQEGWLKIAEVLCRLDAGVAISRRSEEEMIPLKTARDVVTFVSEWLRISLSTFLSAEGLTLAAGFKTVGDLKYYFAARFERVMFLTLKNADRTMSAVPDWAKERIRTAWNVAPDATM